MTAPLGRGRARTVAVVTGMAFAATAATLVAGAASAQPPRPGGGPTVTCVLIAPGDPHVVIEGGPGPHVVVPAAPLPPGASLPDCPDIDPSGPGIVGPGQPGGPHVIIQRGPGVVQVYPARPAPTGSSGS